MTDAWTFAAIVGLACVTVITRSFFFISSRRWPLPAWAERGLQYAPIAALAAVVIPEIVTVQGEFIDTWKDARVFGALAGLAVFAWQRSVLWTIIVGMAVYLPLRLALGW
ncbi:AzlD domain-containing protein [Ramlibacter rhizophilus]|uniref:AzlD domain-containing protein n=1 Tax=Ramlibacter rhizophilus TaxID=1781167 RepID=A0A4Z0BHC0_9BURK|nr:AzlD domain-containing protein [Ramlibacter rhizophilus]TFY97863.1 AzlD domain-containing protein [Ramlibacter rhizophilus]